MNREEYAKYLESPEWKEKARAAKQRAGYRCQVCNTPDSEAVLDAHHRTYERVGHEDNGDLTVLCRKCHELFYPKPKAHYSNIQVKKKKKKGKKRKQYNYPQVGTQITSQTKYRNRPRQITWDE